MTEEFSRTAKDVEAGRATREDLKRAGIALEGANEEFSRAVADLQRKAGISDEALEGLARRSQPKLEERTLWREVMQAPTSGYFEDCLVDSFERLVSTLGRGWFDSFDPASARLRAADFTEPLELVYGCRISRQVTPNKIGRAARMLLSVRDHLDCAPDLNFFELPMFAAEVALLGAAVAAIPRLGASAETKLRSLPHIDDDLCASTVHELLTGIAYLEKGHELVMLEETRVARSPDFRLHSWHVPTVIECKRRRRVPAYVRQEAKFIRAVFDGLATQPSMSCKLVELDVHGELLALPAGDVVSAIIQFGGGIKAGPRSAEFEWGSVTVSPLPHAQGLKAPTRRYSPSFLREVFRWEQIVGEWDGLVCHVEATDDFVVEEARAPLGFRWRSSSETAVLKKSRSVTSLFGDAAKQIPAGELGIVHLAYPEGARADLADARTQAIQDNDWYHRPLRMIPLVFVSRLYPHAQQNGEPDLIESTMILRNDDFDASLLAEFPCLVFSRK